MDILSHSTHISFSQSRFRREWQICVENLNYQTVQKCSVFNLFLKSYVSILWVAVKFAMLVDIFAQLNANLLTWFYLSHLLNTFSIILL